MNNSTSKPEKPGDPRRVIAIISWVALVMILVFAAGARANIPPFPLAEYDTWGWLGAAAGWVGGQGFHEVFEREWLYGAFLAGVLQWSGSFSAIVLVQQGLGLIGGAIAFLTWRVWVGLTTSCWWVEAGASVIGLLVVTMNLLDANLLALEISLRPEGILIPIAFAQLACISLFTSFWWVKKRRGPAIVFGALAVPLAYILYVLKPNWALAVPLTLLPLGVAFFYKKSVVPSALLAPLIGAVLALGFVWLPGKLVFERQPEQRLVLPLTLLTIHGDVVLKSWEQNPSFAPAGAADLLAREMIVARSNPYSYKRLGFDPDYLMYRSPLFPWLQNKHQMTKQQVAGLCVSSYLLAWKSQPADMLRKIFVQFDFFLRPDRVTFTRQKIGLTGHYEHTDSLYTRETFADKGPILGKAFEDWEAGLAGGTDHVIRTPKGFFQFRQNAVFWVPWITGFFAVVFVASFFVRSWKHLQLGGLLVVTFWFAPAGNALTVAVAHALDNDRYRQSYGGLLFFASAAMVVFLAVAVGRLISNRLQK